MERVCKDCGAVLRGRLDKKFCSDQCRNNHNNMKYSNANSRIRKINGILRKNRSILENLFPGKKVHREQLLKMGYDFNYHTDFSTVTTGVMEMYCYDYGIMEHDNGYVSLLTRKRLKGQEKKAT